MAGSDGTAIIKGKSGTGRTLLELHTSDIGHGVKFIKFTIDAKSYQFNVRKDPDTHGYVIYVHKSQVFTVTVDNKNIDFKFWMVPNKQSHSKCRMVICLLAQSRKPNEWSTINPEVGARCRQAVTSR